MHLPMKNQVSFLRYALLFCCAQLLNPLVAQFTLSRDYPVVSTGEEDFAFAWEGGLNAPQPAKADWDGDGLDDLFIFDRMGDIPLLFRALEDGSYEPAAELLEHWPAGIINWVVLRDYNQDGAADIFAYSDTTLADGILVYKGVRRQDGLLEFERQTWDADPLPLLYFPLQNGTRANIYVSEADYPEVADVDCDGDFDILTFNIGGGFVEFFRNTSVEDGNGLNGLNFVLETNCYGGLFEPGVSSEVELAAQPGDCSNTGFQDNQGGARHAGSTLLTFDEDGDGVKELMLGDISFSDLNLLHNGGDCDQAWFDDQEAFYPQNTTPVNVNFFPAGFYLDFNQDGKRDLIGAPNQKRNAEDRQVMWYYENIGTDAVPNFSYRNNQAVVGDMIDLGTGSFAAAVDANADGLMDLVLSNIDFYTPDFVTNSRLELYLNVGTSGSPAFRPTDLDYLGMLEFNNTSFAFAPTFGDIDLDGDQDALVGAENGQLFFFENTAGAGNVPQWANPVYPWQNIDIGKYAQPRIVDLDRDGLPDLAFGTRKGSIDYFRNIGTANAPAFNPDVLAAGNQLQLGGIDTRAVGFFTGYSSPWFVPDGEDWLIYTTTIEGFLAAYRLPANDLGAAAILLEDKVSDIDVGEQGTLLMAQFDDDPELEVILGNLRGGVTYFNSDITDPNLVSTSPVPDRSAQIDVFPNPAQTELFLSTGLSGNASLSLLDLQGRSLRSWQLDIRPNGTQRLEIGQLPAGVYLLRISSQEWAGVKRVVVN